MQTTVIRLVIFSILQHKLALFAPNNALPVGEIKTNVELDEQIKEIATTILGVSPNHDYTEQLYTVLHGHELSIVYYLLLEPDKALKISPSNWQNPQNLTQITDKDIASYAIQRLRWKIEYTNVVYSLLPEEFTLSELQKTYEAILDKPLDKRNFRKKIMSLDLVKPTQKKKITAARPAIIYHFKQRTPTIVKIFS